MSEEANNNGHDVALSGSLSALDKALKDFEKLPNNEETLVALGEAVDGIKAAVQAVRFPEPTEADGEVVEPRTTHRAGFDPAYKDRVPFPRNVSLFQRVSTQTMVNAQLDHAMEEARTSDDPNKVALALNYLLHALDSELIQRVKPDFTPPTMLIQRPDLTKLLSPTAQVLARLDLKKTAVALDADEKSKKVALCAFATKVVPVGTIGNIDESYIQRWAHFLNDMADRGIWKYGTLCPFGIMNLQGFKDTPPRAVIFSFIFTRLIADGESWRSETHEELNAMLGTDVFQMEGDIGSSDWSKFPW